MRKLTIALSLSLACFLTSTAHAQQTTKKPIKSTRKVKETDRQTAYFGLGLGLDHGGLGIRVEAVPVSFLGIFGGAGYNFYGLGYNAGLSFKLLPKQPVTPVILGMYGYNGVIIGKDQNGKTVTGKTYFGATAGLGMEIKAGRGRTNKVSLLVLYPFRNKKFEDDAKAINASILPIAFSVGFAWGITK